jgi:DNA ligase (NAD+)
VAVKPTSKAATTRVIGIEWEMGLSGAYTPVALVEPCELDGTTCKRVNLFNLDFLEVWVNGGYLKAQDKTVTGGFGIGATVLIVRTGDVLPYLQQVISPAPKDVVG